MGSVCSPWGPQRTPSTMGRHSERQAVTREDLGLQPLEARGTCAPWSTRPGPVWQHHPVRESCEWGDCSCARWCSGAGAGESRTGPDCMEHRSLNTGTEESAGHHGPHGWLGRSAGGTLGCLKLILKPHPWCRGPVVTWAVHSPLGIIWENWLGCLGRDRAPNHCGCCLVSRNPQGWLSEPGGMRVLTQSLVALGDRKWHLLCVPSLARLWPCSAITRALLAWWWLCSQVVLAGCNMNLSATGPTGPSSRTPQCPAQVIYTWTHAGTMAT